MKENLQRSSLATCPCLENEGDLVVKQRAELVGKQAGEILAAMLTEILLAIRADKSVSFVNLEFHTHSSNNAKGCIDKNITLTAGEVAQILKISKAEAYRLIQYGEIQGIKFGRNTRVRGQDIESFIAVHMK